MLRIILHAQNAEGKMGLKLKNSYATEVYISNGGYLTIMQDDPGQDEQHHILLTPEQAELVFREMQELLKQKDDWWKIEEGGPQV
jgi:hypothetical protein